MELPKILIEGKPTYTKLAQDADFFALFQALEEKFDTCFLFESLGEEGKFSRYSILGFDPKHLVSARENTLTIDGMEQRVENPYFALRDLMPQQALGREYAGGLVGYLSYEALNYFESALKVKVHKEFDPFTFGVYTDGVVYDKLTDELFYFHYGDDRSEVLKELLGKKSESRTFKATFVRDTLAEAEHEKIVERVKELIRAGNTFQCEVGFKSEYKIEGEPLGIYERLREVNPSPFMYYLKFGKQRIIGASPELLFSLREREMTTKPLAGTTRRGKDEAEDKRLARELVNDPKERAEHTMLVDLHRNDIGRVAEFGSVRVKDLMNVKKFSHVQHISSEITGTLKQGEDQFSALASNFPAGTVTGTPKIEAIRIIDANEPEARGPYAGAVGHFGFNGDCTFALALRSVFINGQDAYAQTSGGIVYDSEPQKEYQEIQNKLAAMKSVLENSKHEIRNSK